MLEALWPSLRLLGLALLLGRILLSFLPPGEPGGHSLRKLPLTLATSLLLGAGLLLALWCFEEDVWPVAIALAAVGCLLRWVSAPAGIVPREDLAREGRRGLSRIVLLAAFVPVFLGWPPIRDGENAVEIHNLELFHRLALALVLLGVEHGLATARRAPLGRRCFVLVLSLYLFRENESVRTNSELIERIDGAYFGAGAAFALAWLRRADRRSGALAVACFVIGRSWSAYDGVLLSAGALLALVLASPRPARMWIARASAIGVALCFAPALGGMRWIGPGEIESPAQVLLRLALVVATLSTAAWIGRSLAARRWREPEEWRADLARGDGLLLLLAALGIAVSWLLPGAVGNLEGASSLQLVAPLLFLLAGCVSIRPERAQ